MGSPRRGMAGRDSSNLNLTGGRFGGGLEGANPREEGRPFLGLKENVVGLGTFPCTGTAGFRDPVTQLCCLGAGPDGSNVPISVMQVAHGLPEHFTGVHFTILKDDSGQCPGCTGKVLGAVLSRLCLDVVVHEFVSSDGEAGEGEFEVREFSGSDQTGLGFHNLPIAIEVDVEEVGLHRSPACEIDGHVVWLEILDKFFEVVSHVMLIFLSDRDDDSDSQAIGLLRLFFESNNTGAGPLVSSFNLANGVMNFGWAVKRDRDRQIEIGILPENLIDMLVLQRFNQSIGGDGEMTEAMASKGSREVWKIFSKEGFTSSKTHPQEGPKSRRGVGEILDLLKAGAGDALLDFLPMEAVSTPCVARTGHKEGQVQWGSLTRQSPAHKGEVAQSVHG